MKPRRLWLRFSLTTKILGVFLALSVVSSAFVGAVASVNLRAMSNYALDSQTSLGEQAVTNSTLALEDQAETGLLGLARDQAAISNAIFEKVSSEINIVAEYASTLWSSPSLAPSRHSYSAQDRPPDIYSASVYHLAPGLTMGSIARELNLSSSMDDIFRPVLANNRTLTWIYIGMESGLFRLYPWTVDLPPEFDARKRSWYQRAMNTGKAGWTELYVDAATGHLAVSYSRPVPTAGGELIGVVAADVMLKTVNEMIINTQVGELGYAFLVDGRGKIIARPGLSPGDKRWDESFATENLLQSGNQELRDIVSKMTEGKTGVARARFDDGEKYVAYAPVTSTGWSIGVVMPVGEIVAPALATRGQITVATEKARSTIFEQIGRTQKVFAFTFVGLILVVIGLSFWISRMITRPVKRLTRSAEVIGGGNLDHRVEVKTGDELETLANSFNKMALDLKTYLEDLRRTTAEKERMQKEMEIGRGIQQSFLPEAAPKLEGFELAALNSPALEIGGDFYDFIPVSLDKWGLVIADVSGKGVPAALFMALSRTLIRANAMGNPTVSEAILRANNMIAEEDRANMFVTLFYGVLDLKKKSLTYINAGHNPPLVVDKKAGNIVLLAARGLALGIMPDIALEEKEVPLREGEVVLLYTDGVTEAVNEKNEQFGQQRLVKALEDNQDLPAEEIIQRIEQEVATFSEGQPQFDDVTLMAVKVLK